MVVLFNKLIFIYLFFSMSVTVANDKKPEPITWTQNVKELLYDDDVKIMDGSDFMILKTPYRALDAAIVPISINFLKDQSPNDYIRHLTIVVDENPSPIVGKFKFSPKVGNASFSTRVRIDKYTYVRAIAENNKGEKYMVSNFVKAAGGCSAPSLADMDSVMERLGKMKMKFIKTSKGTDKINKAKFLISHPNFSGLQFNQLTRSEIPAHFINFVRIEQDGNLIFEASPDISLSEDPSFTFNYLNSGGALSVKVNDSEGNSFSDEFSFSQISASNN